MPYNYIMIESVLAALKFVVETLLVWNTHFLVTIELYKHMTARFAKAALLLGEILVVVMMVMAIYSEGSLIGTQVVWLRVAEPDLIDSIAMPQVRFEAAFFIVQWFVALFAFVCAILNLLYEYYDGHCTKVCSTRSILDSCQTPLLTMKKCRRAIL